MDIHDYIAVLGRRKWLIILTPLVTLLVILVGLIFSKPVYEATTTVRVLTASKGSVDWVDYDVIYTERLMNTFVELASSAPVRQQVAEAQGLDRPPRITAEVVPDTELMRITAAGTDPAVVADTANAVAQILITQTQEFSALRNQVAADTLAQQVGKVEQTLNQMRADYQELAAQANPDGQRLETLTRSLQVQEDLYASLLEQQEKGRVTDELRANNSMVVEPATTPLEPAQPNRVMMVVLGGLAGLLGGLALAFLFERLDTRLHTSRHIQEAAGSPVLGTIPHVSRSASNVFVEGFSPAQEPYRHLGAKINALAHRDGLRTLLVTSTEPGEGKSAVVSNLASALAQSGRRVVAVDVNLRRPTLHRILDVPNKVGLSNILEGELALGEGDQYSGSAGVWVIPSGTRHSGPAGLLASRQLDQVIQKLAQQFDIVLLDTPSVLDVADVAMLAPMVDGVLLVVRRGHARRGSVRSAAEQLADLGARVLGVVVNHAQRAKRQSAYGDDRRAVQARSAPRAQASSVAAYVAPQLKVPAKSDGTRRTTVLTKPGPDGSSGK